MLNESWSTVLRNQQLKVCCIVFIFYTIFDQFHAFLAYLEVLGSCESILNILWNI